MSLTPPVLLIVLGFPLLAMAGMLMMSGIERKLTDSRAALARSDAGADSGPAGAAAIGGSPRPTLMGPFATSGAATAPLQFALPSVTIVSGATAASTAPASAALAAPSLSAPPLTATGPTLPLAGPPTMST